MIREYSFATTSAKAIVEIFLINQTHLEFYLISSQSLLKQRTASQKTKKWYKASQTNSLTSRANLNLQTS